jgi:hypothetical protein
MRLWEAVSVDVEEQKGESREGDERRESLAEVVEERLLVLSVLLRPGSESLTMGNRSVTCV